MMDILKTVKEARNFPINTCPASRHVEIIAEQLLKGEICFQLTEEPKHCAESMLSTVKSLYIERTKNIKELSYKADADRYQYLKNSSTDGLFIAQYNGSFSRFTGDKADEVIDQAMKEGKS